MKNADLVFLDIEEFGRYIVFTLTNALTKSIAKYDDIKESLSVGFLGKTGDDIITSASISYYYDDILKLHPMVDIQFRNDNTISVLVVACKALFVLTISTTDGGRYQIDCYPINQQSMEQFNDVNELDDLSRYFLEEIRKCMRTINMNSFVGRMKE